MVEPDGRGHAHPPRKARCRCQVPGPRRRPLERPGAQGGPIEPARCRSARGGRPRRARTISHDVPACDRNRQARGASSGATRDNHLAGRPRVRSAPGAPLTVGDSTQRHANILQSRHVGAGFGRRGTALCCCLGAEQSRGGQTADAPGRRVRRAPRAVSAARSGGRPPGSRPGWCGPPDPRTPSPPVGSGPARGGPPPRPSVPARRG